MSNDASVPVARKGSLVASSLEQSRADSVNFAEAARSANTRRAYDADWRAFVRWCDAHALRAAPADGATVALYLTAHAGAVSVATLARRFAAIRAAHEALALSPPAGRELGYVWRGIRRTMGRPPRAKRALTTDDLRALLGAMPDNAIGVRDRALPLVGFAAAQGAVSFRRSTSTVTPTPRYVSGSSAPAYRSAWIGRKPTRRGAARAWPSHVVCLPARAR